MCIELVGYLIAAESFSTELTLAQIGRTGRAGKMGVAITFLTNDDDEVM